MTILVGSLTFTATLALGVLGVARPRVLAYGIFALTPTQFLFVPVFTFFISPADVLVGAALLGFGVRLASRDPRSWGALWRHRYLFLLMASYVVGFLVLQTFSRTLVRVALAIVPSILAIEVLRTRRHLWRAATALVVAAVIDAAYGLGMSAAGHQLHPTRFSGMSDVNFSAMVILTGAAIAFAQSARATGWLHLAGPGALAGLGLATLSQTGLIAFAGATLSVLGRVIAPRKALRVIAVAVVCAIVALTQAPTRERILSRGQAEAQNDGVPRTSAEIRWMILTAAWISFAESPVVGVGYSNFRKRSLESPEIAAATANEGFVTHNTYVEVLVEGGLLAFLCLVMHLRPYLTSIVPALRDTRRRRDHLAASALVGLPIVLIVAALANLLIHYFFWAVAGLALAYLQMPAGVRRGATGALPEPA